MPTFEEILSSPEVALEEQLPFQDSEIVQQFRRDIEYWFIRYQNLYDRSNAAMRNYRFAHVHLVTRIYNTLLTVYGDNVQVLRDSAWELVDLIAERRATLGQDNACLNGVEAERAANSQQIGSTIQSCALYANTTMSRLMLNNFYPAFASIQNTISGVNVIVVDALSRGNVLQDEVAIIEYLRSGYGVAEFQWLSAVSQLLRWETNRFEVDGLFLADEMRICLAAPVVQYLQTNTRLHAETLSC